MACEHGITGPCSVCEVIRLEAEVARLRELAKTNEERWLGAAAECTAERAAHEQTRAELARWREALGGDFGPQTPDAVPVFQREAERVQGQVAACEIAKARARVAELEQKNERLGRAKDGFASRAYIAESALASARTLLERAQDMLDWDGDENDLREDIDRWRSAHPTTGAEKGAGT